MPIPKLFLAPLLALTAVPACAPPLHDVSAPALVRDRGAPGAALLEHALAGFFYGPGATGELTLPLLPMPQAEIDAVLDDGWTAEPLPVATTTEEVR